MGKTPWSERSTAFDRDAAVPAASPGASSGSVEACPQSPGVQDRMRRLQELVRLAEQGQYRPDLGALAEALLDRAPELFEREGACETDKSGASGLKNKKAPLSGALKQ